MKLFVTVILICLLAAPSYAAFNATTLWYVDGLSGLDVNGGAFDPAVVSPGTDEHSSPVAITVTLASTTTGTCSPACSSTTHGPGNFVNIASGVGCTPAIYEIKTESSGTVTFDKAMGSIGNVCVGVIGGNLQTIPAATGKTVTGNTVNVKDSATYTAGVAITGLAGTAGTLTVMRGYHTTPGDAGNCTISSPGTGCVTVQATAGSFTMFTLANTSGQLQNFIFDCNAQTACTGFGMNGNVEKASNIQIKNFKANGFNMSSGGGNNADNIWIHGGTGCTAGLNVAASNQLGMVNVVSESNACPGFLIGNGSAELVCVFCIAANNTGASSDGFDIETVNAGGVGTLLINCGAYKNGRDGFRFGSGNGILETTVRNSWAYGNVGKSFRNFSVTTLVGSVLFNWNAYESGSLSGIPAGPNDITLTANPTVAGDSGNFALNSTSGGGLSLRGTAFPGSIGSSVGTLSLGPIQPLVNSGASLGGANAFVQ